MSSSNPFIVVGLGNPGPKYADTPHNLGFMVVDSLAKRWSCSDFSSKFSGLVTDIVVEGRKGFLLKPQTYMNLSGRSVREIVQFYKVSLDDLIVVSDDLDLPPTILRLRPTGGAGGHNGLKSLIECLGSEGFPRVRIGVGRSPHLSSEVYLLSKFPKQELARYSEAVEKAADSVEKIVKEGIERAMNVFNPQKKTTEGGAE